MTNESKKENIGPISKEENQQNLYDGKCLKLPFSSTSGKHSQNGRVRVERLEEVFS